MELSHYFSGDLQLSANGDLLIVDQTLEANQRVLRRLLTNQTDYLWQPTYGAGLPARIGLPFNEPELSALIRSQMLQEQGVQQSPAPQVNPSPIPSGLDVQISYVVNTQNATLSFQVSP